VLLEDLRRGADDVLSDDARLARREELETRTRRTGWCLGVLSAAHGVDLLRSRHEVDGLRWLVGALVRARGLRIEPAEEHLPALTGRSCADWEVSLLAAWCALEGGTSLDGFVRWRAGECGPARWLAFEASAARLESVRPSGVPSGWPRLS